MFSSVILPRGGPPECSRGGPNRPPLGTHGPGPFGRPWALIGRALVGPPGLLWAPLGPCGPAWALLGRALVASLQAGPLWATLGPYGPGLKGPPGPSWAGP